MSSSTSSIKIRSACAQYTASGWCPKGWLCKSPHIGDFSYKTECCVFFQKPQGCGNGIWCFFKHQSGNNLSDTYRAKKCKRFSEFKSCPKGKSCTDFHQGVDIPIRLCLSYYRTGKCDNPKECCCIHPDVPTVSQPKVEEKVTETKSIPVVDTQSIPVEQPIVSAKWPVLFSSAVKSLTDRKPLSVNVTESSLTVTQPIICEISPFSPTDSCCSSIGHPPIVENVELLKLQEANRVQKEEIMNLRETKKLLEQLIEARKDQLSDMTNKITIQANELHKSSTKIEAMQLELQGVLEDNCLIREELQNSQNENNKFHGELNDYHHKMQEKDSVIKTQQVVIATYQISLSFVPQYVPIQPSPTYAQMLTRQINNSSVAENAVAGEASVAVETSTQ